MDRGDFTKQGQANLVRIADGWAFLPPALPPNVVMNQELILAAERARGAVSELVGLTSLVPNLSWLLEPVVITEAVASTRIEGIETRVRDVLAYRAHVPLGRSAGDGGPERARSAAYAGQYSEALRLAFAWPREGRLFSRSLLREIHAVVLMGGRGNDRNAGAIRNRQVFIGDQSGAFASARYVPPPPEHIDGLLEDLFRYINEGPHMGTLVDCAIVHYQFEAIHPFEDGNGRLGRILIPSMLGLYGVTQQPVLGLGRALLREQEAYFEWLLAVSTQGDWRGWIRFFLDQVEFQATDAATRLRNAVSIADKYRQLLAGNRSKLAALSVDYVLAQPVVSIPMIAAAMNSTYPTAKNAVQQLEKAEVLTPAERIGGGTQYWFAEEILREVYDD